MIISPPSKGIDRAVKFKKLEDLKAIAELGYTFVCRYITPDPNSWKALTRQEAKMISDAGLYVVVVYQNSNNRVDYFSTSQGKIDASNAKKRALEIGMPEDAVIYFAVDFDTIGTYKVGSSSHQKIDNVIAYFKAVAESFEGTKYRLGVYGSYNTVQKITSSVPAIKFKWQTVAWSQGRRCDYNLLQHKIDTYLPEDKKHKLGLFDLNLSNGAGGGWKLK